MALLTAAPVAPARSPDAAGIAQRPAATAPLQPQTAGNYERLPMVFELNQGQNDPHVKFASRGHGYTISLADTEAVISTRQVTDLPVKPNMTARHGAAKDEKNSTLRMRLLGSNPHPKLIGLNEVPAKTDYFVGRDASTWHRNVPSFSKVKYESVYPGIDMIYYGNQSQLEYDFVVAPGVDPRTIRLKLANERGASKASLDQGGDLTAPTDRSDIRFHKPTLYQMSAEGKRPVDGKFVVDRNFEVGFEVGDYDHTQPLIIDPATYLGGSGYDAVYAVAASSAGVYVAGETASVNFPGAPHRSASRTDTDAFVALLTPDMTSVIHTTYYGGSYDDAAWAIAVGTSGVYIAGSTFSADLPMTKSSYLRDLDGAAGANTDGFIAMFSADLTSLHSATYYGGIGDDFFNSICLTPGGMVYAAGVTESISLPKVAGGFQPTVRSPITENTTWQNTFVVEFEPNLNLAINATFLGGSYGSYNTGIASDTTGYFVYVTGFTESTDFPTTRGAQQVTSDNHGIEAPLGYITALANDLSATSGSTYVGEGFDTRPTSIVVTAQNVYVGGSTTAPFIPYTYGFAQPLYAGGQLWGDGFVREYSLDLSHNVAATYLGGTGDDAVTGIALSNTSLYATGFTNSVNFPHTAGGTQHSNGGSQDAFVAQFSLDLKTMGQNTYLGGASVETGYGIAVRTVTNPRSVLTATDEVFIGGVTSSFCCSAYDLPVGGFPADANAIEPSDSSGFRHTNKYDGFVAEYAYVHSLLSLPFPVVGAGVAKP
jgi:hypothetical protein